MRRWNEIHGTGHDDHIGGIHLNENRGHIVLDGADAAAFLAVITSQAVADFLVAQENRFHMVAAFLCATRKFMAQRGGIAVFTRASGQNKNFFCS